MFRVGDAVFGHASEHGPDWRVKTGAHGAAGEALYKQEGELIGARAFRDVIERAFRIAGIEYGRADFGLVDGEPQIYEINTNPLLDLEPEATIPARRQTVERFWTSLVAALHAVDSRDSDGSVVIDTPDLRRRRRRQTWFRSRERYGIRP
jgi:hypothetical protein